MMSSSLPSVDRPDEWVVRAPPPSLSSLVDPYVAYRSAGYLAGVHRGLPSASLSVTIAFGQPLRLSTRSEGRPVEHAMVVGGLRMQAVEVHHDGGHHGMQLSIPPPRSRAVLGLPAAELAHQVVELDHVMPLDYEGLANASWDQRFAVLDGVLLRAARGARPVPAWHTELDRVWSLIAATKGNVRVRDCAAAVGWSRRRLLERFKGEFGITPKEAARLFRFDASRRSLERGESPAATAAGCGYADQSHLNREWRAFAGCSPGHWPCASVPSAATRDQ